MTEKELEKTAFENRTKEFETELKALLKKHGLTLEAIDCNDYNVGIFVEDASDSRKYHYLHGVSGVVD